MMICTFTSLLPLTTRPLPFFRSAAALAINLSRFLEPVLAAAPVVTAACKAAATLPYSDGLQVARSSALAPVMLSIPSTW
ncbi:hypothetical protein D3C72_1986580 [compost metagenome]